MFQKKIYKILSKEDLKKISSEIKKAEENTSAEIVVSIKNKVPFIFNRNVYKFALSLFKFYKVHKTKDRTGILILFVLQSKQFHIIGDIGIYKKINQNVWDNLSSSISNHIKEKSLLDGILLSIKLVSKLVDYDIPKKNDDKNEISDNVRF